MVDGGCGEGSQTLTAQVVPNGVNGLVGMHGDPAVIHVGEEWDPEEGHYVVMTTGLIASVWENAISPIMMLISTGTVIISVTMELFTLVVAIVRTICTTSVVVHVSIFYLRLNWSKGSI